MAPNRNNFFGVPIVEELRKKEEKNKQRNIEMDKMIEIINEKEKEIKVLKKLKNVLLSMGIVNISTAFINTYQLANTEDPSLFNISLGILPGIIGSVSVGYGAKTELYKRIPENKLEEIYKEYPELKKEKPKIKKLKAK